MFVFITYETHSRSNNNELGEDYEPSTEFSRQVFWSCSPRRYLSQLAICFVSVPFGAVLLRVCSTRFGYWVGVINPVGGFTDLAHHFLLLVGLDRLRTATGNQVAA